MKKKITINDVELPKEVIEKLKDAKEHHKLTKKETRGVRLALGEIYKRSRSSVGHNNHL